MQSSPSIPIKTYEHFIVGAAIFDHSGLPKEYFTTDENTDIGWVQTVFQALGLQSLLMSSLRLEGFDHAIAQGKGYFALVVRQRNHYLALLVQQTTLPDGLYSLIQWARTLEAGALKTNPRFRRQ